MPSLPPSRSVALVIMGVAGSGKTTVGSEAARRLEWSFVDADDLHAPANRAKMRAGEPLTDSERAPWLAAVRRAIDEHLHRGQSVVVACSALRRDYRRVLGDGEPRVHFVWLDVPTADLRERLAARRGHFAGPALLESQMDTLEPPLEGKRVEATGPLDEVVHAVVDAATHAAAQG
jgi:gluconokinase